MRLKTSETISAIRAMIPEELDRIVVQCVFERIARERTLTSPTIRKRARHLRVAVLTAGAVTIAVAVAFHGVGSTAWLGASVLPLLLLACDSVAIAYDAVRVLGWTSDAARQFVTWLWSDARSVFDVVRSRNITSDIMHFRRCFEAACTARTRFYRATCLLAPLFYRAHAIGPTIVASLKERLLARDVTGAFLIVLDAEQNAQH